MTAIENKAKNAPISEREIIFLLRRNELRLEPVEIRLIENETYQNDSRIDGVIDITWQGVTERYLFEYKAASGRQTIESAAYQAKKYASQLDMAPLVIVPYLSEEALLDLERQGASGIDLSGNAVILGPKFRIFKSGHPNRYRENRTIRNIYRGNSSIFARCFLLRGEFKSLEDLRQYALTRLEDGEEPAHGAILTKGTASKVVRELEEELIVRKSDKKSLMTIDGKLLLERLRANYRFPLNPPLEGKSPLSSPEIWHRLNSQRSEMDSHSDRKKFCYAATGMGSASRYKVLSASTKLSIYVSDASIAAKALDLSQTRVFPNVELIEEKSDVVYFDTRKEGDSLWASPVQTWLELACSGAREREAAQSLEGPLARSQGEQILG